MPNGGKHWGRLVGEGVLLLLLFLLLVSAGILGLAGGALRTEIPTRVVGPPFCEGLDSEGRQFTAETEDVSFTAVTESNEGKGVVYRGVANTNSDFDVRGRLLPANCQVGFVGFCIGEALPDLSSSKAPLDQQWFVLPKNQGYVHGGVVQELPPGTIGKEPQKCDGGRDEPTDLAYVGAPPTRLKGRTRVELQAENAATVAAAIYANGANGNSAWHPLAIDLDSSDGFILTLDTRGIAPQEGATLLFVACWAGNVPGRATTKTTVRVGSADANQQAPAPPDPREGSSVACKQIAGGS